MHFDRAIWGIMELRRMSSFEARIAWSIATGDSAEAHRGAEMRAEEVDGWFSGILSGSTTDIVDGICSWN